MMRPCVGLVMALAWLAGCASTPPVLVLAEYRADAPPDAACAALIDQALDRELHGAFSLVARELATRTAPGAAPERRLAPLGSHPAGAPRRGLDGTFRALFVDCDTRLAYVARRGGVADITYWFGPFAL